MKEEGIPRTLAPFFQEYAFEKIDAERDAELVIERTLVWGNRAELRWLFARYGRAHIADWVRRVGSRRLPRRQLPFWRLVLNISESQVKEFFVSQSMQLSKKWLGLSCG